MEAVRRRNQELAQEVRARAQAQLVNGTCGLELSGHSTINYNGTYEAVDERDGWPVLQNEHGIWLFRPVSRFGTRWRLWHEHNPESDTSNAYIEAADGSFPIGEHPWRVWDDALGSHQPDTLTMRVVVRA